MGEAKEALAFLDVNAKSRAIVDRIAIMEHRGMLHIRIRAMACALTRCFAARLMSELQLLDAHETWRHLIEQNPDSYAYYRGYLANNGIDLGTVLHLSTSSTEYKHPVCLVDNITEDTRDKALQTLQEFSSTIPRAAAPRRLALNMATGMTVFPYV